MKIYRCIQASADRAEYVGHAFTLYVVAKLGWRRPDDGVKKLHNLALGERTTDDDGWVWERTA